MSGFTAEDYAHVRRCRSTVCTRPEIRNFAGCERAVYTKLHSAWQLLKRLR
jgi:hypothetical protein